MFENSNNFDFDDSLSSSCTSTRTTGGEDHVKRSGEMHQNNNLRNTNTLNTINYLENEFVSSHEIHVQSPSRVIKRKFPGPAGILPNKKHGANKTILELVVDDFAKHTDVHEVLCSQNSTSDFEDSPWQEMSRDFLTNSSSDYLPDKYNIEWIKSQARLSRLINQKAPFLAAVVQSLDVSNGKVPTINVSLKDKSGEIQATVLYNLYDEFSKYFTVGSVLVLKQFGVLTAGLHSNHYLTITPNNLLTIYCKEEKEKSVQKISVQDISVNQIVKSVSEDELVFEKRNDSLRDLNNCPNKTFINDSNSDSLDNLSSVLSELKRDNQRELEANKPKPLHENKFKFKSVNQNVNQSILKSKFTEAHFEDRHKTSQSSSCGVKKPTIFESSLDDLNFNDDFDVPDNFEETIGLNLKSVEQLNKALSSDTTRRISADTIQNISVHTIINKSDKENMGCDSEMIVSQISVKGVTVEQEALWENVFADVDAQAFFEDF